VEVAGNDDIVVSGLAPTGWRYRGSDAEFLYGMPLATDPRTMRTVLKVRTHGLLPFLRALEQEGMMRLDHVYDY